MSNCIERILTVVPQLPSRYKGTILDYQQLVPVINMSDEDAKGPRPPIKPQVEAFLDKVKATPVPHSAAPSGRLIFAMDATASREPSWDQACQIQGQMFMETAALGGLEVQLCYYRGLSEFHASCWLTRSEALLDAMGRVHCVGGHTQIAKLLQHAVDETRRRKVNALVFVGDCMEENVDKLCQLAGQLSIHSVPVFVFHEGNDSLAAGAFRQLARITRGAYCTFDGSSPRQLRDLLSAVAVYAAGGTQALEDFHRRRGQTILKLDHS